MQHCSLRNVFCLAVLLALVAGCGQSTSSDSSSGTQNPCEKASSIRGNIVTISHTASGNLIGGFLLDGTKENQALFDSVYVKVDSATQVFEIQQNECRTLSFTDLKPGQRVQVQSTGIVLQSYPPQIQATEVVILPPMA
jgi:hypothetical protein